MTALLPRPTSPVDAGAHGRITAPGPPGGNVPLSITAPPFSVALHTGARRWILDLRGHLHAHSAVVLDVQAEQLLGIPPTSFVFRLRCLRTVDEEGARRLLRLRDALEARGGSVTITGAHPDVRTVMARITGERSVTL